MRALILISLLALWTSCHALKILVIMPLHGRSHYFPFKAISENLAARGHEVTFITPFPPKTPIKNLEYIVLETTEVGSTELLSFTDVDAISMRSFSTKVMSVMGFMYFSNVTCDYMLHSPKMYQFKAEKRSYDLVIGEAFHTDCFAPFAHHFNVPLVLVTASAPIAWYRPKIGQPTNPSYIPTIMSGFPPKMNFWERMQNAIIDSVHIFYFDYIQEPENFKLAQKFFGEDIPSFGDIISNVSVLLTNSHFSYVGARPNVPGVIEVGGIHLGEPKPVPKNIEKWINESKDGVIYFSMGSMIKGHTFPEEKRKIFLKAFGRLKQRVLWKWENETMPDKPDNVMIQKWMPQYDILCHPNVKAFIAHGGLLGTTEAVHCGVPVVVMPQFGDQHTNARALEAGGGGVVLNFREADEEMVYNALKTVLDPEFNKKAKELSARFRDRPMSPMDTAIYWIEYVARHKGAHHMRTAAVGMPLYQYLLLDVFGFLAVCTLSILFIGIYVTKLFFRLVMSMFSKSDKKQKKLKKN
ncbi:UDP-glucosyltransferase 2-like isoform X6 [Atheta coriaria]|uniref:UDP-glucosyltransferase 2-like isoform X6 n=1 Tax=Dalotia coriaria TaxID=877792 RepID=UPI0031F3730C